MVCDVGVICPVIGRRAHLCQEHSSGSKRKSPEAQAGSVELGSCFPLLTEGILMPPALLPQLLQELTGDRQTPPLLLSLQGPWRPPGARMWSSWQPQRTPR